MARLAFVAPAVIAPVEETLDRIKYDVPAIVLSDIALPGH